MLKGKGISDGIGLGKAILLENQEIKPEKVIIEDIEKEKSILYKAVRELEKETEELINKLSGTERDIIEAYLMILKDPTLLQNSIDIIEKEKCNAEYAIEVGLNLIIQTFEEMDDPYMSSRSRDIADMKKKIIAKILNKEAIDLTQLPKNSILVTKELTTSDTAKLDLKNIAGIITEIGGINSHMAIMARTHEIPAIVGIKQIMKQISNNDFIAINGTTGEIFINPSKEEYKKLEKLKANLQLEKEELKKYKNQRSITKDGQQIEVLANIGNIKDIELVISNTAEGVRII